MKILFFSENFPPERNAAATRVYERALYWVKWGAEITVITCTPNFPEGKVYKGFGNEWYRVEDMDGIRVVRVKTFISANEGFLLRTLDFISFMITGTIAGIFQKKHNLVIATSPQFFTAVAGWIVSVVRRTPFIFELGDLWPATIRAVGAVKQSFLLDQVEKLELFLYRRSAAVVALTQAFKDDLISRNIPADKVFVVRNGVDLSRYEPIPKNQELVSEWGLEDRFVVGYIGTHGPCQDLSNVLEAAKVVKDPLVIFLFVGSGAERAELIERAEQECPGKTKFIEAQPKERMQAIWSICDVALVHLKDDALFETVIPSKLFESMGMGLPIVLVAPQGEASEILEEAGAGLYVPAGQPGCLGEVVEKIVGDQALYKKLAKQSHRSASRHSRESQARDMMKVLERIVPSKSLNID